jgi:YesN/AraC family two-component response regulator
MYKLMFVDDEKLILDGLKYILDWNSMDIEIVHEAKNGKDALEKFKEDPVDIVITDINMPIMSGLTLIKEIKKINKDVSFIVLSGYDEFSYAQQAITLGVENYILKPIDDMELEETIKKICKKKLETEKNNNLEEQLNKLLSNETSINDKYEKLSFEEEIDKLHKLIIEKDRLKIIEYLETLFDKKELSTKNIFDLSVKIFLLIDKISYEFKIDKNVGEDSLISNIIKLFNEKSRENIKYFIILEVDNLLKVMNSNTEKFSPVIQQIIRKVKEYYYEELSLKVLANDFNINSSYLGQLFTKEVGMSFSDYLNKEKNSKAKELILNTNMKINDIARQVGYSDTSYFYRKFKKYYGVSPAMLRELKNY